MAVDWIGFGYAAAIAIGGFIGYKRKGVFMALALSLDLHVNCLVGSSFYQLRNKAKLRKTSMYCLDEDECCQAFEQVLQNVRLGSVMSLMAGLVFGWFSAYGAYNTSNDPKDIKVLLITSGVLSFVMGTRYKKSGKVMPAGIMSGLSLLMVFRLLLLLMV